MWSLPPKPVPHCCFVASAGFPILWVMGELSRGDQARLALDKTTLGECELFGGGGLLG